MSAVLSDLRCNRAEMVESMCAFVEFEFLVGNIFIKMACVESWAENLLLSLLDSMLCMCVCVCISCRAVVSLRGCCSV